MVCDEHELPFSMVPWAPCCSCRAVGSAPTANQWSENVEVIVIHGRHNVSLATTEAGLCRKDNDCIKPSQPATNMPYGDPIPFCLDCIVMCIFGCTTHSNSSKSRTSPERRRHLQRTLWARSNAAVGKVPDVQHLGVQASAQHCRQA